MARSRRRHFDKIFFKLARTKNLSFDQLGDDALTFSAVQYLLIILTEAIKRLPAKEEKCQLGSYREFFIELDNGLIRDRNNADSCKVWNSIQNELPKLREKINTLLKDLK